MGFDVRRAFRRIMGWSDPTEEPLRAAELALWAATGDEEISPEEVTEIAATLREVPGLERFDESDVHRIIDDMEAYDSDDAVLDRVAALAGGITSRSLRRVCFQLCAHCAMSDGTLTEDESDFLEFVREAFELSESEAKELFNEVSS